MALKKYLHLVCLTIFLKSCFSVKSTASVKENMAALKNFLDDGERQFNEEPISATKLKSTYDFIIVGAGTAGCTLANRLTEIPEWQVLLIEAGGRESFLMDIPVFANFIQLSSANWNYTTEPSDTSCLSFKENRCVWPRGKVMGGSSVLNYMIYTRGNKKDYDTWEELGNEGWGWNSVKEYFKKLENCESDFCKGLDERGYNGYLNIQSPSYRSDTSRAWIQSAVQSGYRVTDYNGASQTGVSYLETSILNGTRHSASRAYLHPIRNRPNLHVLKDSFVTKIIIDKKTRRTTGVQFLKDKKKYKIYARNEVIVSGGAVNSPKLLMLSGIGPKEHLEEVGIKVIQDSQVGYNLMDHIAAGGISFTLREQEFPLTIKNLVENSRAVTDWMSRHEGPLTIAGGCEALALLNTKNKLAVDEWADIELLFSAGTIRSDPSFRRILGFTDEVYDKTYGALPTENTYSVFPMLLRPKSTGRISLRNANPFTYPLIEPNYYQFEEDVSVMIAAIKEILRINDQPAMKLLDATFYDKPLHGCAHFKPESDEYWECYIRHNTFTIYHPSGTCKMGPDDDFDSVVDPRLRVYGIAGLRVVDASIMPVIPSAHTNGPVYMVAEKAADMIKEDWGKLAIPTRC